MLFVTFTSLKNKKNALSTCLEGCFYFLFDDPAIVHNPSPRLLDTPCVLQQQDIELLFVQNQITQERPDLVRLPFWFDLKQSRKPGGGFVGQVVLGEVADVLDGLVALVGRFLGVDDAFALGHNKKKKIMSAI